MRALSRLARKAAVPDRAWRTAACGLLPSQVCVEEGDDALFVGLRVLLERRRMARRRQVPQLGAGAAGLVVELAPCLLGLAGGDEQVRRVAAGDLFGE